MRVAIVSDIHGNLSAFEAVLADLRQVAPDLVLHGGDLADSGSRPVDIVDHIRALGWPGVMGNTDEMLIRPDSLENFARHSSAPPSLWNAIREIASATRAALGEDRLTWLQSHPLTVRQEGFALVHATPGDPWRTLGETAGESEIQDCYKSLDRPAVVFGHTHRPAIRAMFGPVTLLINTGSVGLPFDGDARASYLLMDNGRPSIRRVEYNLERELQALSRCGLPGAAWTAKSLRTSSPQLP